MDDYPYDLGGIHVPVTTSSAEAQTWFDRGLAWLWGYNHDEAVRCFERAASADPGCAMAQWGAAYASGPNYNMPWWRTGPEQRAQMLGRAHAATGRAMAAREGAAPHERALIEALPARYPQAEPLDEPRDMAAWNEAFADAMRAALAAHPESHEVRAAAAEALMNLTPWAMWDQATGRPAERAATEEAMAILRQGFERPGAWEHPGLLHLWVHLLEMSPTPEAALPQGDRLRTLIPDAGHLVHMPTHIDVQVGDYAAAVLWNEAASRADLTFYAREGALNLYAGYRAHNYHFAIYGAMLLGRMGPALHACRGLAETLPTAILDIEDPPMADFFESYLAFEPHVLVRFGRWEDAARLQLPGDPALRCTLAANVLYARAVALSALGRLGEARVAEAEFLAFLDGFPKTRLLHNNAVADILEVARHMVRGELAYREGDHDAAFEALGRAVAAEDALRYDEPWGWMQPSRHALGALALEQGRVEMAERAFREDLGLADGIPRAQQHPGNVWALRGLLGCLERRGETAEIVHVRQALAIAEARADGPVRHACLCAGMAGRGAPEEAPRR